MTLERILVVGGGFLGQALARRLNQLGHRVTILSSHGNTSQDLGDAIIVRGKQEDEKLAAALLAEHGTVIHTAWGTTPGSSSGQPETEMSAGLAPWLTFLETLRRFPSVRLIFLSSGGTVYGNPERVPTSEDSPLRPLSCHGAGKAAAELFLGALTSFDMTRPVVVRPSNVYGPGQPKRPGFGVVRHLLQCAIDDTPFGRSGNGMQVRDYLYIDDFTDAIVSLVSRRTVFGTFNVGSGDGTSLRDLISLVEDAAGRSIRVDPHPPRQGDVDRIVLDVSKLHRTTGWMSSTSLADGISRTWQWIRSHH